ncbi:MAG TPA: hypothetical protein VNE82_03600 [Candidatus Binataceae bacterium]|nr:hypothetical protein [Candidatus Binataceae bacterium]
MSNYYEALTRLRQDEDPRAAESSVLSVRDGVKALVPVPTLGQVPAAMARAGAIRNLSERLAPLAVVEGTTRVLVTGCRPGDGASTVATALAIDLSQRLGLRTMLVDAHLRHPALHRLLQSPNKRPSELLLDGALQMRATAWPRLELATCCLSSSDSQGQLIEQFEGLLGTYSAVIADLGVIRLDARMLPLARRDDPIVAVVRQGHTERHELATTAAALRAASRPIAGVILNDATDPVAKPLRRLLG